MRVVELVFAVGWGVFWLYWLVAAFSMKRGRVAWSRELRIRAVIVVLAVVLIRVGAFRHYGLNDDPWRAAVGLLLFAAGLGLAVWARVRIGRNWGTPMTEKAEPELVTSGPYRLVRHPIYSGILAAGVGTGVALSWLWLVVTALAGIYFVYSATVEERFLARQFPDSYPGYRRSTKMLVPFLLALALVLAASPSAALVGSLTLTVPRDFHRYPVSGGLYKAGTRPPVIGWIVTDYAVSARSPFRRRGIFSLSLPGDRVALELQLWLAIGPGPPTRLRLPLSLGEPWVTRRVRAGTRRYGWFDYRGREYEAFVWTGRKAPSRELAALSRTLASVRPRR